MRSFTVPVSCSSLLFFFFSPCFFSFVSALFLLSGVCWLDGGGAAGSCPCAVAGAVRMQRKMGISSKEWLGLRVWLLMVTFNYLPGRADFGNQVHAELPKKAGTAIRHLADPIPLPSGTRGIQFTREHRNAEKLVAVPVNRTRSSWRPC